MLLAGLSACGPAPSDHAPSLEPRASLGGSSEAHPVSQNNPSTHHDSVTPVARPGALASPLASRNEPASEANEAPVPLPERLVLPEWIAKALDSPDIRVRLRALDRWAQQGPTPRLIRGSSPLDDKDDKVREKAMAIIEQHWAVERAREPPVEQEGEGEEEQGSVHHE